MDYPYLFYKDLIIPVLEIKRMLKSDNIIYIQTKDELYKLDFDDDEEIDETYDELVHYLAETFNLGY